MQHSGIIDLAKAKPKMIGYQFKNKFNTIIEGSTHILKHSVAIPSSNLQ